MDKAYGHPEHGSKVVSFLIHTLSLPTSEMGGVCRGILLEILLIDEAGLLQTMQPSAKKML